MSKHTPGPWNSWNRLNNKTLKSWRVESIAGYDGVPIACIERAVNPEEQFANARLIAAAPELLEALRSIQSWMEDCLMDKQVPGLPSRAAFDRARAAIAKATGE